MDVEAAVEGIRSKGCARVVTFLGFSGAGYENEEHARRVLLRELARFDPADTLVCAGATSDGIGMVYPLAAQQGFRTAGIVSSRARNEGAQLAEACGVIFMVDDDSWGGRQADGRLSPTSTAMVAASDVMIAIGGGAIARDELQEALRLGKTVRFHPAEMDRARAVAKAAEEGAPRPRDFGGEAQGLFSG